MLFIANNFNGILIFEIDPSNSEENIKNLIEELGTDGKHIDALSIGPHLFVKYWTENAHPNVRRNGCTSDFFGIYNFANRRPVKSLSSAYFISNLIYSISKDAQKDRLWLLFPAEGGKELYRVKTACLSKTDIITN